MKQFIFQHIEVISTIIGTIFFVIMINLIQYLDNTKYEVIYKSYFIMLLLVGIFISSQAIGKWLIK